MSYKVIDLFSGTGAFAITFNKYNKFKCIYSNDMEASSETITKLNIPNHTFKLEDLNKIHVNEIPNHDILCGGFPCQPFSIAGEKKGFNDERSNVFWKILDIIKKYNTKVVILENVKNLISHDKKKTFKKITEELTKLGYHIKYKILDTCKITKIPQHRERIYIICFKDKYLYDKFNFNFEEVKNNHISNYIQTDNIPNKYYYTDKLKVYDIVCRDVKKNISENVIYQYRRYYIRENKSNCCPTLTANMGSGGHNVPIIKDNKGIRKLTPLECFNLQGFPSNYKLPTNLSDSKLYKLAGNAVSIPVIELIIKKLNIIM
jgi:DNA (cytosine-5)-methyltransferase 1